MTDPSDTRQLAERASAGSMQALADLYDAHAAGVYRVACRLLQNEADAEDVVQDVFVGLPRALRSWRGEGSLDAWIRQVAARTALMRLRTQRRRPDQPQPHLIPQAEAQAEAEAEAQPVDRLALRRALAALGDDLRTVFMLKVVEGYSHDEIAELLGITVVASRTRLSRARRDLSQLLR